MTIKDVNKLSKLIRLFFWETYRVSWGKLKRQGRYDMIQSSNFSNIFSEQLSINQFKFIQSARIDTLRVLNVNKLCRKCHTANETQLHIFTQCPNSRGIVINRHY